MTNFSRVDDSSQLAVWRLPHILISAPPAPPPLLLHKGQTQCLPVPCRQVGRNCSMVIFMLYYHELACLLVLWWVWAHKSQALASCSVQFYKHSLIKQLQFYNHTASSQLASSLGFVSKMLTSWQWIQSKFHQTLQAKRGELRFGKSPSRTDCKVVHIPCLFFPCGMLTFSCPHCSVSQAAEKEGWLLCSAQTGIHWLLWDLMTGDDITILGIQHW